MGLFGVGGLRLWGFGLFGVYLDPKVCRIISFVQVLGHGFTYFLGCRALFLEVMVWGSQILHFAAHVVRLGSRVGAARFFWASWCLCKSRGRALNNGFVNEGIYLKLYKDS